MSRQPFGDDIQLVTVRSDYLELQHAEADPEALLDKEALRESEERYRLIVETAAEGVWLIDADEVTTFVNPRLAEILGVPMEEIVGRSAYDFIPAEEHASAAANAETLRTGGRCQFERRLVRADGAYVDALISTSPMTTADGRHCGSLGMVTDITEHKRLQLQLQEAKQIEAIGGLAGGVAHDFNNSMMAIRGFAELLLRRLEPADPRRRSAEGIKHAADRAAAVTRRLLAYGRRQVLQPEVLNVNDVVRAVEQMLRRTLGDKVELELVLTEELPRVKVDPGRLEEVILELTDNALDSMPDGGRLTIRTAEQSPEPGVTRHGQEIEPGRYVMIAVSDNGTGIPEEAYDRVTEPFFTTKELGKGSGMGLPTVLGIVKQSGGYVSLATEVGKGSTFNVFFPFVDEATASTPADAPGLPDGAARTVLLVEDDEVVRAVVAEMLVELGYVVREAEGSHEALELAGDELGMDILLTDVVMPGLGGPELAAKLSELRPDLRVLYMSGYTARLTGNAEEPLGPGASFLQKPFTFELLRQKLDTLGEQPSRNRERST
jgi:two-component system cell cycle sensor histidine kinase/response regulator CckA